jgi:hypothetical protein
MPITAKLSRQFYEKLGDEVTNELVTWLNAVDDSYRQEFRDLFDANFGQVRAEMAQLRAEMRGEMGLLRADLRAEMKSLTTELRAGMTNLTTELRADMTSLATELRAEMTSLATELRSEMAALRGDLRGEMAALRGDLRGELAAVDTGLRAEMDRLRDELTVRLKSQEVRLIRWMVGLWLSSMLALAGFMWSRILG